MDQTGPFFSCRLCFNNCSSYKSIDEIFDTSVKYFDPKFLNKVENGSGNFTVMCLECWNHIIEFHDFQQTIIQAQTKFEEQNIELLMDKVGASEVIYEDDMILAIKVEEPEPEVPIQHYQHRDHNELVCGYIVKEEEDFINPPDDAISEKYQSVSAEDGNNSIFLTDEQEFSLAKSSSKIPFIKSGPEPGNLETKARMIHDKNDEDEGTEGNTVFSEDAGNISPYNESLIPFEDKDGDPQICTNSIVVKLKDEDDLMDISESELDALEIYENEYGGDEDMFLSNSSTQKQSKSLKPVKSKITKNNLKRKATTTLRKISLNTSRINHQPMVIKIEQSGGETPLPEPIKMLTAKRPKKSRREEELDDVIAQWRPNLDCRICQETYATYTLLQQHFREIHSNEEFYVKCCDIKIKKRGHLAEHIRLHMDNKAFKCTFCNQRCNRKRNLRLHMAKKHGITNNDVISVTGETVKMPNTSDNSIEDCKFIAQWLPNLECVLCKNLCSSFTDLKEHFHEKHTENECYILCCGYKLNQETLLAQHLRERTHPRAYKCELCNGCFTLKRALEYHMRQEHADKNVSSPNIASLNDDMPENDKNTEHTSQDHLPSKLGPKESDELIAQWLPILECDICKKSYANFTILKKHFTQIHPNSGGGYVVCCQRKFFKRYKFQEHARTHFYSKAFKCELCGKRYSRREGLQSHMTKQHCGNIFKEDDDEITLTAHNKESLSTKELHPKTDLQTTTSSNKRKSIKELDEIIAQWKPNLECVVCQETYATYTLLQDHFRQQHPGTECYVSCCRSKFAGRYDIEEHMRYHNDPNAFKCEHCGRCFARRRALNGHVRTHRTS